MSDNSFTYRFGTHLTNWTGIWSADKASPLSWTLIGKIVTLMLQSTLASASNMTGTITNVTALPTYLRPTTAIYLLTKSEQSGTPSLTGGSVLIGTNGIITIYATTALATFTSSASNTGTVICTAWTYTVD